jgi:hypothetical protein
MDRIVAAARLFSPDVFLDNSGGVAKMNTSAFRHINADVFDFCPCWTFSMRHQP